MKKREVVKLRPTQRELWDEVTVARLEMAGNGDILEVSDLPKKLVQTGGPME